MQILERQLAKLRRATEEGEGGGMASHPSHTGKEEYSSVDLASIQLALLTIGKKEGETEREEERERGMKKKTTSQWDVESLRCTYSREYFTQRSSFCLLCLLFNETLYTPRVFSSSVCFVLVKEVRT